MRYLYPCDLTPDEDDWLTVSFPDVPEAGTDGRTREEALEMAEDALTTALAGYVHERWDIPAPSARQPGQELVALPPVVAAKLALYSAMRAEGMTKVALAAELGLSEGAVRKLLDPDHRSHIGQVLTALKKLGRTLVVEDKAALAGGIASEFKAGKAKLKRAAAKEATVKKGGAKKAAPKKANAAPARKPESGNG